MDGVGAERIRRARRRLQGAPGHDHSGRFIPYWNRGSGEIRMEQLINYDVEGAGDYYQIAKRTGREVVLEPYVYPLAGRDVWVTSLVVPIHDQGRFIGAAGVDIALSDLQEQLEKVKPLGIGYVTLLSNTSRYVADPDASLTGREFAASAFLDQVRAAVKGGEQLQRIEPDSRFNGDAYRSYQPVTIGKTGTSPGR